MPAEDEADCDQRDKREVDQEEMALVGARVVHRKDGVPNASQTLGLSLHKVRVQFLRDSVRQLLSVAGRKQRDPV